ncbi:tyrosine-type recombinase/integrase [Caldalkalibacillus salinus]|uniref:tyrosine-type recombinase/integrase n=1 Tax=Caldalkalibacillus salinus TaxID=2803787 RepID=UPI001921DAB1|nr:tyrosine-type recombinase/integrase [Caldalkalibacillus salinus]
MQTNELSIKLNSLGFQSEENNNPELMEGVKKTLVFLEEKNHLRQIEYMIDEQEKERRYAFEHFTDDMMLYYYIHRPTHIRADYSKKQGSIKEYIRDLMQFYGLLVMHSETLQQDVKSYVPGSILKNIEKRHVRHFQYWLRDEATLRNGKKGYSMATMLKKVTIVKSFLKWLYEVDYISYPVYEGFLSNQLRMKDRPRRDLTYDEAKMLIDYYQNHPKNHALLTLFATSGSRSREIAMANWCDLYQSGPDVYLRTDTKGDKERDVLILPVTFERLQTWRKRLRLSPELDPSDSTPLFTTARGNRYNASDLTRYVRNIITQTQLPFLKFKEGNVTPHWFRHYFAQEALNSGADLYDIMYTLGHASVRTTEVYLSGLLQKRKNVARHLRDKAY